MDKLTSTLCKVLQQPFDTGICYPWTPTVSKKKRKTTHILSPCLIVNDKMLLISLIAILVMYD